MPTVSHRRRHDWAIHHDVTLTITRGRFVRQIAGTEWYCLNGCPVRKRETNGGGSRVISWNRGRTWGSFGEAMPPCGGPERP